ncbi:E3 ubiquitin-protein ligase RNF183-like [Hemicordylus capensis]|uniref:E3 ubiquitin-protein ligase RNF183-like n=1 Tax=Hemicordylus capensis TaxID=884348 RepID=UPI00230453E6|nr:E3 ubiquitin-protein ligase RNF183-like [Hemicordylus capensis]
MAAQPEPSSSGGDGGDHCHSSSSLAGSGGHEEMVEEAAEEGPVRAAPAGGAETPFSYEEYECRICYNLFDLERHAPKLLECLHTFCLECLRQLHLRAAHSAHDSSGGDGNSDHQGAAIKCPLCAHRTVPPGGSPHNLPTNTKRQEASLLQLMPLLEESLFPRLVLQASGPACQRPLPEQSSVAATTSTDSLANNGEQSTSSQDRTSRELLGCVFAVSLMLLFMFRWMDRLTFIVFLGLLLGLLLCCFIPFMWLLLDIMPNRRQTHLVRPPPHDI